MSALISSSSKKLLPFYKYHGIGNDFLIVNNLYSIEPLVNAKLASELCNRHLGVGADGVIMLLAGGASGFDCEYVMKIINSDGSEPQMCGNGIRCLAKFIDDEKLCNNKDKTVNSIKIGTLAGPKSIIFRHDGNIQVDMGKPMLKSREIPTTFDRLDVVLDHAIEVNGQTFRITCVSMGNPHAVIFVDEAEVVDLEEMCLSWGPLIEKSIHIFPEKTNVEFVQVILPTTRGGSGDVSTAPRMAGSGASGSHRNHLKVCVWERGCGFTQACGTGACAAVVAAKLLNKLENETETDCRVSLPGGDLFIQWSGVSVAEESVFMTGPAKFVFRGDYETNLNI